MITRIFLFLIGFSFMVIGLTFKIIYLNLFSFGFTRIDYLKFILTRTECYLPLIGIILIICTTKRKGESHDICL